METTTIYQKLNDFRQKCPKLLTNSQNTHFKNKYLDLQGILEVINPVLAECKLVFTQTIEMEFLKTLIIDLESKEELISNTPLIGASNMQQLGSAITYARRYSLLTMLGIIADEDDDGSTASNNNQTPAPSQNIITEWLSEAKFNEFLKDINSSTGLTTLKKISEEIKDWQTPPKGMKKEYRTILLTAYQKKTN